MKEAAFMRMDTKYVYDETGRIEAAIVPIDLWKTLSPKQEVKKDVSFDPSPFRGMLQRYKYLNVNKRHF
jgi:hypothetical protein